MGQGRCVLVLCRNVVYGCVLLIPGNSCCKLEVLSVEGLKEQEFLLVGLQGMLDSLKVYKCHASSPRPVIYQLVCGLEIPLRPASMWLVVDVRS